MSDTQITILGMSGAGKTCYLLGLYYKMVSGMKGFSITTNEDKDVELRERYAKMCDQTLGRSRFPAGTDNIATYEFELQCGYKTIMSFDWVDYPGGMLSSRTKGDIDEYERLKNDINKSSSLFICVDGSFLTGEDTDEKIDKIKEDCSAVINKFFSDYLNDNNLLPVTAIIITKYDLCKDDTDEEELCEIIEEAFSSLFVKDENENIVTIIPVSIGTNIMDDDYSGKMKPLNIHLPIFMGIKFALEKRIQEIKEDYCALEKEKAKKESRWFFKNKDEIQQIKALTEKDSRLLNAMSQYNDKLEKELEKIPYVYKNGVRTSFSDIFN